jgi:hypothetical protein
VCKGRELSKEDSRAAFTPRHNFVASHRASRSMRGISLFLALAALAVAVAAVSDEVSHTRVASSHAERGCAVRRCAPSSLARHSKRAMRDLAAAAHADALAAVQELAAMRVKELRAFIAERGEQCQGEKRGAALAPTRRARFARQWEPREALTPWARDAARRLPGEVASACQGAGD